MKSTILCKTLKKFSSTMCNAGVCGVVTLVNNSDPPQPPKYVLHPSFIFQDFSVLYPSMSTNSTYNMLPLKILLTCQSDLANQRRSYMSGD